MLSDGQYTYRSTRNWENLQRATFMNRAGKYDIPKMLPVTECDVQNWIGFNFAQGTDSDERKSAGLHFWLDNYQFQRLWADPDRYIPLLKSFAAVMSPDFSVYNDFPEAVKIWNVYRNAWLACYWQVQGITVIPTLMWGNESTFEYCLDGYPENGIVAVSTEGNGKTVQSIESFVRAYNAVLDRLKPKGIIVHGRIFEGMEGNIICKVDTLTSKIKQRVKAVKQCVEKP